MVLPKLQIHPQHLNGSNVSEAFPALHATLSLNKDQNNTIL